MSKYEDIGNSQIMSEIVMLQAEHEAIKIKILKEMDNLDRIEKLFKEANTVLADRIKGQTNE